MGFWRRLFLSKLALLGAMCIGAFLLAALLAPILANYDPTQQNLQLVMALPDTHHPMGTDELGRDIFSRVLMGARTSLFIGVVSTLIGGLTGIIIGAVAGYCGGKIDIVVMRVMDTMMAFPTILLALLFVTILGVGLNSAIIAVGIASIPRFAMQVRGSVLSVKQEQFIEAAYVLGQNHFKVLFKHILPNCVAPIIVQVTLTIGNAILTVSGLGFLGLGAKPGEAEWGAMLSNARAYLSSAPHVAMFPGLAIAFTVLGFNLLGDGLRDTLDVRQK
jgi:ABC-type dipeptide/oligopeptide/nickel transport systems, permease components